MLTVPNGLSSTSPGRLHILPRLYPGVGLWPTPDMSGWHPRVTSSEMQPPPECFQALKTYVPRLTDEGSSPLSGGLR
jgi:hypothetical protein